MARGVEKLSAEAICSSDSLSSSFSKELKGSAFSRLSLRRWSMILFCTAFLEKENCPKNYTLILDSHHNAKNYITEKIKAGMFNLGYLPGSGNKALTTKRETTLPAVQGAIEMLDHDGILLVAVYPGHEEGNLEGIMLKEYFSTLSRFEMSISQFQIVNSPTSPYFFIVEKK